MTGRLRIGGTQLQRSVGFQRDVDRLDVDAAVSQFDHGIPGLVLLPLLEGVTDAMKRLVLADPVIFWLDRLENRFSPHPAGRATSTCRVDGSKRLRVYSPPPMSALKA